MNEQKIKLFETNQKAYWEQLQSKIDLIFSNKKYPLVEKGINDAFLDFKDKIGKEFIFIKDMNNIILFLNNFSLFIEIFEQKENIKYAIDKDSIYIFYKNKSKKSSLAIHINEEVDFSILRESKDSAIYTGNLDIGHNRNYKEIDVLFKMLDI